MVLFSPTLLKTSSFVSLSVQLMRSIFLHIHIYSAFISLASYFLSDHISALYRAIDYITVFTSFFFPALVIPLVNNSFLLLKVSFAIPILVFICLTSSILYKASWCNHSHILSYNGVT